jgi:ribonuclease-3
MNDYSQLEKRLNYTFKNKQLIIEALTHKSDKKPYNNERLEFLGDAVLDLIVGEYLFSKFPNSNEGILSKIRADQLGRIYLPLHGRREQQREKQTLSTL